MTTDRPYQPAVPLDDALDELRRCAGTQFDPDVVQVFCQEAEAVLRDVDEHDVPEMVDSGLEELVLRVPEESAEAVPPEPADESA
jgi:HD-GYP domain-containing protein (c-di-GMP phosphodiesterase class II)